MVKAVNPGGEAQSIADFIVMEPEPEISSETQTQLVIEKNILEEMTLVSDIFFNIYHKFIIFSP